MSKCFHCGGTLAGSYWETGIQVVGKTHSEEGRVKVHEECWNIFKKSGRATGDPNHYTVVDPERVEVDDEWTPDLTPGGKRKPG